MLAYFRLRPLGIERYCRYCVVQLRAVLCLATLHRQRKGELLKLTPANERTSLGSVAMATARQPATPVGFPVKQRAAELPFQLELVRVAPSEGDSPPSVMAIMSD